MRSRFVLFLVAALVFAPGWGDESLSRLGTSSDLAARALAPTFEEANAERTAKQTVTRELDGKTRSLWHTHLAGVAAGAGFQPPSLVLLAAAIGLAIVAARQARFFQPQRAPPRLTV